MEMKRCKTPFSSRMGSIEMLSTVGKNQTDFLTHTTFQAKGVSPLFWFCSFLHIGLGVSSLILMSFKKNLDNFILQGDFLSPNS